MLLKRLESLQCGQQVLQLRRGQLHALEKTAYLTLGCKSLTVRTDHQPLIPIINRTDMEKMRTPRQIRLKEKLLRWDLRVVYIPG
jgi:hypothetical protein